MNCNDEVDPILDDALAEYRDAEPLAGLEERVLRRLETTGEPARSPWWRWSTALACAALVAIAAWIGMRGRFRETAPSQPPVAHERPSPERVLPKTLERPKISTMDKTQITRRPARRSGETN